jgi:hypothetical protein
MIAILMHLEHKDEPDDASLVLGDAGCRSVRCYAWSVA